MPTSDRRRRAVVIGVVLMFASVLLFGLAVVLAGTERHAYDGGALPPNEVSVKQGSTYQLSVPGGVKALIKRNISPTGVQCQWSSQGSGSQLLDLSPENGDSKATNMIATFVSPISGPIHVDCIGWGTVFIDDADNASFDYSGLFLILGMIAFGVGLLLLASPKITFTARDGSASTTSEDDDIQRLVHLVHIRSEDGEVSGPDRPDVTP
jgi:MFS family permease